MNYDMIYDIIFTEYLACAEKLTNCHLILLQSFCVFTAIFFCTT